MEEGLVEHDGRREHEARVRHVTFGAMLVVAGIILALHQLNIFHVFGLWPLFLVGLGISKIAAGCCAHARKSGAWLLAFGLWFTLNELTSLRYRDTWPMLIVAVGILIVWDAVSPSDRCSLCAEGHHDR